METIYSVDAYHLNSPLLAAQAFAREYWAQPRKVRNFVLSPLSEQIKPDAERAIFAVVDGSRAYAVYYKPEIRGVSSARWEIRVDK